MSNAVSRSILLLVGANLLAAFSDVTLKVLNGEVPIFEYVFIRQLISTGLLFPFWWKLPKEQRQGGLSWITFSRAQLILLGSACAMIAVTYLPLATANAMFYVATRLFTAKRAPNPKTDIGNGGGLCWGADCATPRTISMGSDSGLRLRPLKCVM